LHHGGLVAGYSTRWGHPLWAPCIPPAPTGNFIKYFLPEELAAFSGMTMPEIKILTHEDIATVVRQFAEGAARAQKAGFDADEIHSGHGYLLSSFISPKTNSRTDEYGGPIENRLRILREVLAAVRAAVGPEYPVWVKLDSREVGKTGGISLEDAKFAARTVEAAGADAITVSAYHDTGNGSSIQNQTFPISKTSTCLPRRK
jgi:2,4-dienoyl-CoA reductase-like NADH-dependent reductase (Old Yellow Enzyme family)